MKGIDRFLDRFGSIASPYDQEAAPPPDLRDFVACTWVRVVRHLGGPELSPILPDGCADIMAYDDAPPRVAGPDATTRWTVLREGTVITGLRIRPGAVRSVLGCPARQILDGGARLSDLAPGAAALHQRLLGAATLGERHALLEDWVRAAVRRAAPADRAVIDACRRLTAEPQIDVSGLARALGWDPRTIRRQFRGACGYGPKHFQRIMRIQKAIREAQASASARLSDVAQAAGYADQAHMNRDFRDITGFTPGGYFKIARPGSGTWIEGW